MFVFFVRHCFNTDFFFTWFSTHIFETLDRNISSHFLLRVHMFQFTCCKQHRSDRAGRQGIRPSDAYVASPPCNFPGYLCPLHLVFSPYYNLPGIDGNGAGVCYHHNAHNQLVFLQKVGGMIQVLKLKVHITLLSLLAQNNKKFK